MQVFLGVSRKKSLLALVKGDKSFWCTRPSYGAESGDLILLHMTGSGISQIYRIDILEGDHEEIECEMRGMKTARTTLIANLDSPITVKQMRSNALLRRMPAMGRNFQGTTFRISPNEWVELENLIVEANPYLDVKLKTLS